MIDRLIEWEEEFYSILEVEYVPETDFPEHVWCQLTGVRNDKLLIGVCHRTPSIDIFSYDIHGKLRQLLNEIRNLHKHCIVMGDFNYRFLQWPPELNALTDDARLFCNALDFMFQHVTNSTRNDAILDLILTDEQDMINDISDMGSLASSVHSVLFWKTQVHALPCNKTR